MLVKQACRHKPAPAPSRPQVRFGWAAQLGAVPPRPAQPRRRRRRRCAQSDRHSHTATPPGTPPPPPGRRPPTRTRRRCSPQSPQRSGPASRRHPPPRKQQLHQHRPPAPVHAATPPGNDQRHHRCHHHDNGADADHVLGRVAEVERPDEVVGSGSSVDRSPSSHQVATGVATTRSTPATVGQRAGRPLAACPVRFGVIGLRLLIGAGHAGGQLYP